MSTGRTLDGQGVQIKEGKATITFPGETTVFYNPVQEFNRDLSISVLRQFIKDRRESYERLEQQTEDPDAIEPKRLLKRRKYSDSSLGVRVLEALAATGLRAIRYGKEVDGIKEIVANDMSAAAVACMKENVKANNVENIVTPSQKDAMMVMHENKTMDKRFDVIDLDPYGSPAHFLDAAVQCISDGGLLMVTCTDLATLCGNTPEASFAKYGSMSLKSKACHEIALRILLNAIERQANRYERFIEPLLSIFVDFYIRIFVRVYSGAKKAKISCCRTSMIYQCCGCEFFSLQPLGRMSVTENGGMKYQNAFGPSVSPSCDHCGSRYHIAGPVWNSNIHNVKFVNRLIDSMKIIDDHEKLGTHERIFGVLNVVNEELPDVPLFYLINRLANIMHCPVPPAVTFRSAVLNAGYRISNSHVNPNALKTDAPMSVIWDIMRCWNKKARQGVVESSDSSDQEPTSRTNSERDVDKRLRSVAPTFDADFTLHPAAESTSRKEGIMRFQPKLHKNWGPKTKAKGSVRSVNAAFYASEKKDEELS